MKLIYRSPVNHWWGEFLRFPHTSCRANGAVEGGKALKLLICGSRKLHSSAPSMDFGCLARGHSPYRPAGHILTIELSSMTYKTMLNSPLNIILVASDLNSMTSITYISMCLFCLLRDCGKEDLDFCIPDPLGFGLNADRDRAIPF